MKEEICRNPVISSPPGGPTAPKAVGTIIAATKGDGMRADMFKAAVESGDHEAMVATLTDDCVLHSPITFKPFEGRDAVATLFGILLKVFEDFTYTDALEQGDAATLVFRARVGDRQVEGVDLIRFRADGLIEDFTVFVRPLSGALALRDAVGAALGLR